MSYEGIRITDQLDIAVQRAVRITPWRHETLGELVRDIAAQREGLHEDLISVDTTSNHREQECR
jgi:hypothetical protein